MSCFRFVIWKKIFIFVIIVLASINIIFIFGTHRKKISIVKDQSTVSINDLTFEKRVQQYKEIKKKKDLEAINSPITRIRTISTQFVDDKSLKNPVWGDITNMEQFYNKYEILALGNERTSKAFAVFGIPTVFRNKAYYILNTVKSLVSMLREDERKDVIFVIFIADFSKEYKEKVVNDMKLNFPREVKEGLIQVIYANEKFYPNLAKIPHLYGDKEERVKWRSKQCLDYSYLYYYCADLANYFIQLEDDIEAEKDYLRKIKHFIKIKGSDWSVLEFGARGFIGMTYRTRHLKALAKFVRFYFWTMPVDWMFRIYNDIFLHGNKKTNVHKPPLFLHVGAVSSLNGQKRKLEDLIKRKHQHNKEEPVQKRYQDKNGNPDTAILTTTIEENVDGHDISEAYSKTGFFWGKNVNADDYIEISLYEPLALQKIVFVSGSQKFKHDTFSETELLISNTNSNPCKGYKSVNRYSNNKVIEFTLDDKINPVKCIRLVLRSVLKDSKGKNKWLLISEIALITKN